MASCFSTGPVDAWVQMGYSPTPQFLGHSKSPGFRINVHPYYEPVMCDLAGPRVNFDRTAAGEDAIAAGTIIRWNENVYAGLANFGLPGLSIPGTATRGLDSSISRGTLYMTQNKAVQLWLRYPLGGGVVGGITNIPGGYRFPCCVVEGPEALSPGAQAYEIGLVMYAWGLFNTTFGTFLLYDNDMSALPPLPPY